MEPDGKKISFGFSKLAKKPNVFQKQAPIKRNKIQLIDCLEGQTIKLKDAVKAEVKGALVIPLQSSRTIFDHHKEKKVKQESKSEESNVDDRPDSELTPDELAARELIREAQNSLKKTDGPKVYSLSAVVQNTFEVEGKEEPTMNDYESIPISEYGLAMLRGMGWSDKKGVGKIPGKNKSSDLDGPAIRPKGLGLGANKLVNHSNETSKDKNGEELVLKKGGYGKIIEGKHKGNYCEVQVFDEDGRVIVKTSLTGLTLNLNQLFVKPVSKEEYVKSSKVINNAKYEEYKNKTESKEQEAKASNSEKSPERRGRSRSTSKSRRYGRSDSEESDRRSHSRRKEDRNNRDKSKKKYRSPSNSSSDSDYKKKKEKERKHKHKSSKSKHRRRHRSSSDYDSDRNHSRKSYSKHRH